MATASDGVTLDLGGRSVYSPPDSYATMDGRKVFINDSPANAGSQFRPNIIVTSKYTWYNFIFKSLFEQFRRIANFYFLLLAAVNCVPAVSTLSPVASIMPLLLVLLISALKEAYEDVKRHRQDDEVNARPVKCLRGKKFEVVQWRELAVGDIVKVKNNEFIPADLVLLSSSEFQGLCYVETANLDGETNLKIYESVKRTSAKTKPSEFANVKGSIECEHPNNRLYKFDGKLTFADDVAKGQNHLDVSLSYKNALLRGCQIRNTKWAVGVAVYTGKDTKLMQNATQPPSKRSSLEKKMDKVLLVAFGIMLMIDIFAVTANRIFLNENRAGAWYLAYADRTEGQMATDSFLSLLSFIILFATMIPISLYVSMEMVKLGHAFFIDTDLKMFHEATGTAAKARTSNLSEQLGQIEFIFSDKTGTLTQNKMEFMKCSIGSKSYGQGVTEIAASRSKRRGEVLAPDTSAQLSTSRDPAFPFKDKAFLADLEAGNAHSDNIRDFLTILSVCHTVIPELDDDDEPDPGDTPTNSPTSSFVRSSTKKSPNSSTSRDLATNSAKRRAQAMTNMRTAKLRYQAASPDENALVSAAKHLGYYFYERGAEYVKLEVGGSQGRVEKYEILNINEFNSTRKRMSVVVRMPDKSLRLLLKGADSIVAKRLAPSQPTFETALVHLQDYASDGLRTLVLAQRFLTEKEYQAWNAKYHKANTALIGRDKQLEEVAEEIEVNLQYVGSTAIEDKLQDGVPDTIAQLARASIKLWVLTGDKQETAINIGFACSLLTDEMKLLIVNAKDSEATEEQLDKAINAIGGKEDAEFALIIDGETLEYALDPTLQKKLLDLAKVCKSVICCRVSPLQKADVVRLVKKNLKCMALAIGDGANDVSMIQAAHIGVGISGQEGMQAVMASDYAVAQFRFLKPLLLVHGRLSYKRLSGLILYALYKNFALVLAHFWVLFFNGFSAQTYYDSWYLTFYNVFFTSLPMVVTAGLNQDVNPDYLLKYPQLYWTGQQNRDFTIPRAIWWLVNGIWQSIVVAGVMIAAFSSGGVLDTNGRPYGFFELGNLVFTSIIICVNLKMALEVNFWHWFNHIAVWGSLVFYFGFALIYNSLCQNFAAAQYYIAFQLMVTKTYWMALLLSVILALLPDFCFQYVRHAFFPGNADIIREVQLYELKSPKSKSRKERETQLKLMTDHGKGKRATTVDMQDVIGSSIGGAEVRYTGYAFSQDEGQKDWLDRMRGMTATTGGESNNSASGRSDDDGRPPERKRKEPNGSDVKLDE